MNPGNSEPPTSPTASLRSALAEIDAELAALRVRVEELAAARKPLVKALKAIVYPILTLPVEITAEIFLRYVDWAEICNESPCAPVILASVCKQWRAVALHLEPIWSRLQIFHKLFHGTARLEGLLVWWVPRTGGRLLDVDCAGRLLTALIPHSTRWRTLSCDLSTERLYPDGLVTIQGRIPHLETLCINLARHPVPTGLLSIFSDAPLLREAHITSLTFDLALPWEQLTTLGLAGQFPVPYTAILQRTPQLQTLHLEGTRQPDGFISQTVPPVTLHHLHKLKIQGNGDRQEQVDALLGALTLPALRDLQLGDLPEDFGEKIVQFLARSNCSLASMSFHSPSLRFQFNILDNVYTPTELHIIDIDWTSPELESFFFKMDRSTETFPYLRTLSMSSSRLVDVPYAAMAEMVASRQGLKEDCARLESFQFTLPQLKPVDDTVSAMFDNASVQGCRIDIQGSNGFNIGSRGAAHSYTLEPSYQIL
ncbi:hypothetical protein C8R46DRAFT_1001736 [Mycena filopes]|nr:hypothetical protein C8R46DRAFT_1001736 [Mycena filopes]